MNKEKRLKNQNNKPETMSTKYIKLAFDFEVLCIEAIPILSPQIK